METRKIEEIFKKTRELPLVMSFAEIESMVSAKGVTGPPKKSWWNLNNIIIMSSSIAVISIAISYLIGTPVEEVHYQTPEQIQFQLEPISTEEDSKIEYVGIVKSAFEKPEKENKEVPFFKNDSSSNFVLNDGFLSTKNEFIKDVKAVEGITPEVLFEEVLEVEELSQEQLMLEAGIISSSLELQQADLQLADLDSVQAIVDGESRIINKEVAVEGVEWFQLTNSRGNIKVESWDKPTIQMLATVTMDADSKEDLAKGLEDFEIDLVREGTLVKVNSNWEKFNNCMCTSYNWRGKKKVEKLKTEKGEKIEINKVQVSYVVKVPKSINLELSNTYAAIEVEDRDGDLVANVFKGNIDIGNVKGKVELSAKYGDAKIGSFNKGQLVFYKAKGTIGNSEELRLKANYSDLKVNSSKEVKLTAFKSDIVASGAIGFLEGEFRYGDLELKAKVSEADLVLFKSDLIVEEIENADLNMSYTSLEAEKINELKLTNTFQTKLKIEELGKVRGELRYSPLKIGNLKESIDLLTFKGKVNVKNVHSTFSKCNLESKYTELDLKFEDETKFNLEAETMYTNVSIPSGALSLNYQKQGNNHSDMKGVFNASLDKEASLVTVNCFKGSLSLQ